jgi:transposase
MDMQRIKHTAEFKAEAVKQVVDKGHAVVDVATRLRLREGLLYTWVRKSKAANCTFTEDMQALQAGLVKL